MVTATDQFRARNEQILREFHINDNVMYYSDTRSEYVGYGVVVGFIFKRDGTIAVGVKWFTEVDFLDISSVDYDSTKYLHKIR